MATLPAFFRKNELPAQARQGTDARSNQGTDAPGNQGADARGNKMRTVRDPFRLRTLPHEHLFLYTKRIDNSRLVREADPKSRPACWRAIGAACVVALLVMIAFAPSVFTTIAGYKLEDLRVEERRLVEEDRVLDVQKAELLSPARLDQLARENNLVTPSSSQVFHLEGKPQGAVAMAK